MITAILVIAISMTILSLVFTIGLADVGEGPMALVAAVLCGGFLAIATLTGIYNVHQQDTSYKQKCEAKGGVVFGTDHCIKPGSKIEVN